jgi:D-alanyl-lipoteichoic acid acyltransferase DltB (MBOAT superfamily)
MAGIRLNWRERIRLFFLAIGATWFCLALNWPALQAGQSITWSQFFQPGWEFAGPCIAVSIGFALLWPLLYEAYFRLPDQRRRKAFLVTSMCANLGMLAFFKYFNFFRDNLVGLNSVLGRILGSSWELTSWLPPELSIALPVGISFYTFVTMSYGIDAYRGLLVPERSFVRMALFVSYFPHLVAGPIIRPDQLLPTLHTPWRLHPGRLTSGFHLVLVGLFKKLLIADSVSPLADQILNAPAGLPSLAIWLGTILFAIQIYCDFSGYTDVARGVSRMLGVELPLNFDFPYFSTSIVQFWRRWHISLSTWLRDYLYIPLGGGRVSPPRVYFNLLVTMALGGLWHGASWNFLIWGCYQGALLCINRLFSTALDRRASWRAFADLPAVRAVSWAVTMYFVLLGWLIFRVTDLNELLSAAKAFIVFDGEFSIASFGLGVGSPIVAVAAAGIFVVLHAFSFFCIRWATLLDRLPSTLLPVIYLLLGMAFFLGWPAANSQFIYFQF